MLNVLHILWSAHFGGVERLVLDLASAQARSHHMRVSVLFGRGEGEMLELYRSVGLTFHDAGLVNGFHFSLRRIRELKCAFLKQDVLHFHAFIPVMARVAATATGSIVYTEHGNFALGRQRTLSDHVR